MTGDVHVVHHAIDDCAVAPMAGRPLTMEDESVRFYDLDEFGE